MTDVDLGGRMRRDWDARAELDPWHYVLFREPGDWQRQAEEEIDRILGRVDHPLPGSARALEIGCGVGRLTWALARRAREVWALDVSPRMLELARGQLAGLDNVRFLQGDGTSLAGVADRSMDLVLSALTFTHLPRRSLVLGYLREAARVLAAGGLLAVQVNNEGPARFLARLVAQQGLRALRLRAGRRGLEHGRTWTGSRVSLAAARGVLEGRGLRLAAVDGAGSLACWIYATREGRTA